MAGRVIPVADKAIATAALTEILTVEFAAATGDSNPETAALVAAGLVNQASRVVFQPSTRQLVLKFDLAFGEPDLAVVTDG